MDREVERLLKVCHTMHCSIIDTLHFIACGGKYIQCIIQCHVFYMYIHIFFFTVADLAKEAWSS